MPEKLTEKSVKALTPPTDKPQRVVWDSTLPGFGIVIGRPRSDGRVARTFIAERRVNGKKRRATIGKLGEPQPSGELWNVRDARTEAQKLIGEMAAGIVPGKPTRESVTLRQAMDLHVKNMRMKNRSERSISGFQTELSRWMKAWLDRPLVELTAAELSGVADTILKKAKPRAGCVNRPGAALAKRVIVCVSACWESADAIYDLPKNPARKLTTHDIKPRQERIPNDELPAWHAKVKTLKPIRRDLQLLAIFTGLRSESICTLRHDDVDRDRRVLHVRRAKGDKPYTIPLSDTAFEILERRRRQNDVDEGWVFPTVTRTGDRITHISEPKEYRTLKGGGKARFLPGLHTLRKTFNSVAIEVGIAQEHREALMNHAGHGVNVKAYGFPESWEHLAACTAKIEAALLARIKAKPQLRALDGGAAAHKM